MQENELIEQCEQELAPQFKKLEEVAYRNQCKVMEAFQKNKIALQKHKLQANNLEETNILL